MPAGTRKAEPIDTRMVILVRKSEQAAIEKQARKEKVSAAEILRRSWETYRNLDSRMQKHHEEQMMKEMLGVLTSALAGVNESVSATCDKLDQLHLALKSRELA